MLDNEGYHKFFILDGKKLDIQNFDMNQEQVKKGTASELKRSLVNQCKIDWFQSSFKQIRPGFRINGASNKNKCCQMQIFII